MIESTLYTYLISNLSGDVGTRVYPLVAPEKFILPLLIYNTVSEEAIHDFDGAGDFLNSGIQIDTYAANYGSAKTLAKKVRQLMSAWATPLAVYYEGIALEMVDNTVDRKLFRVSMRFIVSHLDT